jgi:hypothetical protein
MMRKSLLLTVLFFIGQSCYIKAQNVTSIKFEPTNASTRKIHNPVYLVNAIIKGKESDKEKFDAIYNWVVQNIDYDYKTLFLFGGSFPMTVKKILKTKKTLCINYAFLMDTLCSIAEIKNTTILGYAKDELFDVHDSIYFDNHAWNAVKLDGIWYLYDITFSSGQVFYRYTKFYGLINSLIQNVALGSKQIKIKTKKRFFFENDCLPVIDTSELNKNNYRAVIYIKHKLLFRLLSLFKPRVVRAYKKGLDADYYLMNPELFAIQHVPDNPDWALTSTKSIKNFEGDSSFYYLDSTTFNHQIRQGKSCPDCETDLSYDRLNWNYNLRKKSLDFNFKNRWIASECESRIALMKFIEAKRADDSLTKVTLLDTTKSFIKYCRLNMKQCGINERTNYILQKEKNSKKLYLLFDENKRLREFLNAQIKLNVKETKNLGELDSKIASFSKTIYRRGIRIQQYKKGISIKTDRLRVEKTIITLKNRFTDLENQIQDLGKQIENRKRNFENTIPYLYDLIWEKVKVYDSLSKLLDISTQMRSELLDNYKKEILETQVKIESMKQKVKLGFDSTFNSVTESCLKNGEKIIDLIELRNKLIIETFRVQEQLVGFREIKPEEIDLYTERIYKLNREDFCWLRSNKLNALLIGFKSLSLRQKALFLQINFENRVESTRSRTVMAEHSRRMKNHMRILKYRRKSLFVFSKKVQDYKRKYLQELSKERKKQKKE